ncbi:peptidoglycan DD-metalloendopeptidase family protein [Dermacoccaceae bacterium W4C1]
MRTIKNRTATAFGILALTASGLTGVATSTSAQAAERDGKCDAGEFCYNFNSDLKGAWSDHTGDVPDLGSSQPSCYEFKGTGNGAETCVKNHAGGYKNNTDKDVTVYFNSQYGGESVTLKAGDSGRLPDPVYNDNASHKIGGGTTTPPPSDGGDMSDALYNGGGGSITAGFDGYENTSGRHEGIDFKKGYGSDVLSLTDGEVVRSGGGELQTLAIYLPKEDKTVIYLHTNPTVSSGATVKKGQKIATEADNGAPTHTHVEMRPGKQTNASKSVNDPTLDNPNPTSFWQSLGYAVK